MSEPTYRIEAKHDDGTGEWWAYVYRLSDDKVLAAVKGESTDDAISQARERVRQLPEPQPSPPVVYVDDHGDILPAPVPQSLRVVP